MNSGRSKNNNFSKSSSNNNSRNSSRRNSESNDLNNSSDSQYIAELGNEFNNQEVENSIEEEIKLLEERENLTNKE
jgi:hypothetical protein